MAVSKHTDGQMDLQVKGSLDLGHIDELGDRRQSRITNLYA